MAFVLMSMNLSGGVWGAARLLSKIGCRDVKIRGPHVNPRCLLGAAPFRCADVGSMQGTYCGGMNLPRGIFTIRCRSLEPDQLISGPSPNLCRRLGRIEN